MVAEDEEQSDVFSELSESELMAIATDSVSHSRDAYSRACRRVKTIELSHVLSNLSSSNISLANALVGDKGAIALAEALCNNPIVMSLNLQAPVSLRMSSLLNLRLDTLLRAPLTTPG